MMKKLITSLIFFVCCLNAYSQLAPVGTKWIYETLDLDINKSYYVREEIIVLKDTLIDGTNYSQIKESFYTKENSKIYYYKNGEKLLFFDFDVKVGDSIFIDHFSTYNSEEILTKKYPIYINKISYIKTSSNDSLKVVEFKFNPRINRNYSTGLIVEKILTHLNGLRNGPFDNDLIGSPQFEGGISFKCYSEPTGFNFKLVDDCNKVGVKNVEKTLFEIYPNPVTDFLYFKSTKKTIENISIYNVFGELVYHNNHVESAINL